jgi:Holliday junction resolvase
MESISRPTHDEAVRRCAVQLLATGYQVRARVEGWFEPPDPINGYRPDIIAVMGDHYLIVEVKKGEIDWPKISALEQFVHKNRSFEIKIVSPEDVLNLGR